METRSNRKRNGAFTLLELLIVLAILVILAALLLPALNGRGKRSTAIRCMVNLKQVEIAIIMWTTDHDNQCPWQVSETNGGSMEAISAGKAAPHFRVLAPYIRNNMALLLCPTDKARHVPPTIAEFNDQNVSYFINLDSVTNSTMSVQFGDRHLEVDGKPVKPGLITVSTNLIVAWTRELHGRNSKPAGVLSFVDGHAQVAQADLADIFQRQPGGTNRLAIP
jgi:prepilin-type N-terminal cleavage/methylation domain-containing protein